MSLKVIVPNGRTEITVNGLHQWDYGREIEIHAANLPAQVEVHFACTGMETAVVRNCAVLGGKVTAAVPDICLEQTTPIKAWVYAIGETSGETILTIKLPITQRTKPQPGATVPEKVSDKYTEAIEAMNTLVAECEETVKNAADEVAERVSDEFSESLAACLVSEKDGFKKLGKEYLEPGIIAFKILCGSDYQGTREARVIVEVSGQNVCISPAFIAKYVSSYTPHCLRFVPMTGGLFELTYMLYDENGQALLAEDSSQGEPMFETYYKYLVRYPVN